MTPGLRYQEARLVICIMYLKYIRKSSFLLLDIIQANWLYDYDKQCEIYYPQVQVANKLKMQYDLENHEAGKLFARLPLMNPLWKLRIHLSLLESQFDVTWLSLSKKKPMFFTTRMKMKIPNNLLHIYRTPSIIFQNMTWFLHKMYKEFREPGLFLFYPHFASRIKLKILIPAHLIIFQKINLLLLKIKEMFEEEESMTDRTG